MEEAVKALREKLVATFGPHVYYISPRDDVGGSVLSNDGRVFYHQGKLKGEFWYYDARPIVLVLDGYEDQGDQWKLANGGYLRKVIPGQVTKG